MTFGVPAHQIVGGEIVIGGALRFPTLDHKILATDLIGIWVPNLRQPAVREADANPFSLGATPAQSPVW